MGPPERLHHDVFGGAGIPDDPKTPPEDLDLELEYNIAPLESDSSNS